MKNPLNKRLYRELKKNRIKYGALFLMLTAIIGFVSGMYIANGSMEAAAAESYEKYTIEDGHFELKQEGSPALLARFEEQGIRLVAQHYKDQDEDHDRDGMRDGKIRIFKMREDMNRASLHRGAFPSGEEEIVIDRMHADNCGIQVGDVIRVGELDFRVSGLVAFSDYSALFEKATDTMFDAISFNIAAVSPEGYDRIQTQDVWQYAFQYTEKSADETAKKEKAEALVEQLAVLAKSGGLVSTKEEADKLSADIDAWTAYLEDIQDRADALQAKADPLEEAGKALEAEKETLEAESAELEKKGEALKEQSAALEEKGKALAEKAAAYQAKLSALSPQEQMAQAASLQEEAAQLKAEEDALTKEAQTLTAEGEALQKEADALTERGEDLASRGEALQKEADALKPEIDSLEAEEDKIEEVKNKLEALEPYEAHQNEVTEFVPEYANQAIHFAISDFGSDKAMGEVLMVIFIVVLAFIFALTTSSTITEEAAVIGTLRASGYSRGEMLWHYAAPTVLVTLLSALLGNILGYTVLKNAVVGMYYNSYSLPVYETRWSSEALVKTTLIPVGIMLLTILLIIARKLRLSPLRFLRRDLSRSKRQKALRLPRWGFFKRFRIRIFLQNFGSYLTLILGIFFVMVLLAFALGLPATLDHEKEAAKNHLLADYQTILKNKRDEADQLITTAEPSAEAFSIASLKTVDGTRVGEEISVYGYQAESRYFDLPAALKEGEVYVSQDYKEKFSLKEGQSIRLKDKYGAEIYDFKVAGFYKLPGSMALLLPQSEFNRVFDREEVDFDGFLSEKPLTDIPEKDIAAVLTLEDVLKMANQMDHSLGGFMKYFSVICMGIAFLLIFLLTKLIIEKNALSISMVKVLGYENREVNALYVRLTSYIVVGAAIITALISQPFLSMLWGLIMKRMNGWFGFYLGAWDTVKIIFMLILSYLLVAFFDMRRIKKIPLTDALKNVE